MQTHYPWAGRGWSPARLAGELTGPTHSESEGIPVNLATLERVPGNPNPQITSPPYINDCYLLFSAGPQSYPFAAPQPPESSGLIVHPSSDGVAARWSIYGLQSIPCFLFGFWFRFSLFLSFCRLIWLTEGCDDQKHLPIFWLLTIETNGSFWAFIKISLFFLIKVRFFLVRLSSDFFTPQKNARR